MTSFRHSKEVFCILIRCWLKRWLGSEVAPGWSNWTSTTPFNEQDLIRARDLARGGEVNVWEEMKVRVRWMGKEKPLPTQINVVREVRDNEDDSDDDEMEI
jgi:hypothetical protein